MSAVLEQTPAATRQKKTVLFVYKGDKEQLLKESYEGKAPNEFLYGLPFIDPERFHVKFFHDPTPYASLQENLFRPFQQWFSNRFAFGFNMHYYWKHRKAIGSADYVITTLDSYGLPILWQKTLGRVPGKVIYISQGLYSLSERSVGNRFNNAVRRRMGSWLAAADAVVTLGEGDARAMRNAFTDCFPISPKVILFGIDDHFWTPGNASGQGEMVLSIGSDSLRDYSLLLKAIDDQPLRIVTRQAMDPSLMKASVVVDGNVDWVGLRELYRKARFVVSPIKKGFRNSGHSATLQAMACGKAVILSNTEGLWDKERMRHKETCYLVEPGNVEAMRQAIRYMWDHPEEAERIGNAARRLIEEEYSSQKFGDRLQECLLTLPINTSKATYKKLKKDTL